MKHILKIVFLFLYVVFPVHQLCAQTYITHYNEGQEALKQNDFMSFNSHMVKADSLRPNHPVLMYNLAKSYALTNRGDKATETLGILAHFYASENILDSTDFNMLLKTPAWSALNNSVSTYLKPKSTSQLAFEIKKQGFHPEGIFYDSKEDLFYLTDIREGLVYKSTEEGKLERWIDLKKFGFWSPMGIAVDPVNSNTLWITTTAVENFSEYKEEDAGKSALLEVDKKSGELVKEYVAHGNNHNFGDLIISSQGKVYTSDSSNPYVYSISENADSLTKVFHSDEWWNLQGLALSDDEETLYVSDYIRGIYKIDVSSGLIEPLIKENERLRGGDGIYQKNGELLILQNGSTPKRVARIKLDKKGFGVPQSLSFPDQALEELEEPTLGTWVDGVLYYIGNSPWGYYDEVMLPKTEEWPVLKVFKLKRN